MSFVKHLFLEKHRYYGQKVTLRPLYKKDIPIIVQWFSDTNLMELGFGTYKTTTNLENLASSYLKHLASNRDQFFAIDAKEVGFIGFISYQIVDPGEKLGRIGILIGKQSVWGMGYGKDAVETALSFLFIHKELEKIELDTAEFNVRAQRCFEICGFIVDQEKTKTIGAEKNPKRIWYAIKRAAFLERYIAEPSNK